MMKFDYRSCFWSLPLAIGVSACGVEARGNNTGGVPREVPGFAVVNSDYASTSVSLVGLDGAVLSRRFTSSADERPGLSAALSGDVVLPSSPAFSDELVLIDRSGPGVLTWLRRDTAEPRAQLDVGHGFSANPQDYLQVSDDKAYVSRHAANLKSGAADIDRGSDLLIIDPRKPAVHGRVDLMPAMAGESGYHPRASQLGLVAGLVRVLLLGFNADFSELVASRLASIDPETDRIEHVLIFDSMNNCGSFSVSPNGEELVVACTGAFGPAPEERVLDAGIVRVRVSDAPEELGRVLAPELQSERVSGVAHLSDDLLLFSTPGRYRDDRLEQLVPDTLRLFDLAESEVLGGALHQTVKYPFSLGDIECVPDMTICVLADAESGGGVLHHYRFSDQGNVLEESLIRLDTGVGLPPRTLGRF